MATRTLLERIQRLAERDDWFEEEAEEFLFSHHIPLISHSRPTLIAQAWAHGWRPIDAL